jgi:hypothetical protein
LVAIVEEGSGGEQNQGKGKRKEKLWNVQAVNQQNTMRMTMAILIVPCVEYSHKNYSLKVSKQKIVNFDQFCSHFSQIPLSF